MSTLRTVCVQIKNYIQKNFILKKQILSFIDDSKKLSKFVQEQTKKIHIQQEKNLGKFQSQQNISQIVGKQTKISNVTATSIIQEQMDGDRKKIQLHFVQFILDFQSQDCFQKKKYRINHLNQFSFESRNKLISYILEFNENKYNKLIAQYLKQNINFSSSQYKILQNGIKSDKLTFEKNY